MSRHPGPGKVDPIFVDGPSVLDELLPDVLADGDVVLIPGQEISVPRRAPGHPMATAVRARGKQVPSRNMTGLRGRLSERESMARHTIWGIGGPAERFYEPADVADLCVFMAGLPAREPLLWLGLGSNLLVRDGGIEGTVIHTGRLKAIDRAAEHVCGRRPGSRAQRWRDFAFAGGSPAVSSS